MTVSKQLHSQELGRTMTVRGLQPSGHRSRMCECACASSACAAVVPTCPASAGSSGVLEVQCCVKSLRCVPVMPSTCPPVASLCVAEPLSEVPPACAGSAPLADCAMSCESSPGLAAVEPTECTLASESSPRVSDAMLRMLAKLCWPASTARGCGPV